jgi:HSP20 family molecular chaperone IbpA
MCIYRTFTNNYGKINIMKKLLILFLFPLYIHSNDIFFECEIEKPESMGSYANITYNPQTNVASFESDFMEDPTPARGTIFRVIDVAKTGDELIITIDVMGIVTSTFRVNRQTLELSGNRNGQCKIVEKELAF